MLYILATRLYGVQMLCRELVLLHLPKANASGTVAEFSRKAQDTRVRNILITLSCAAHRIYCSGSSRYGEQQYS